MKIKSAMLRRLKKEYESYDKETKNINCKIEEVEAKNKQEPNE